MAAGAAAQMSEELYQVLQAARESGDRLEDLTLEHTVVEQADFSELTCRNVHLHACRFLGCDFSGASLYDACFQNCQFESCRLSRSYWQRVLLDGCKRTAPTSGRRALKAAVWRVGGSATEIMSARYGTAARLIAAASRNLPWRRAELGKPSFSTWILPVLISSERASGDATSLPVRWTALPSQRPVPNSKAPGSTQVRLPWLPGF